MFRLQCVATLGLIALATTVFSGARAADAVFTEAWEGVWDVDFSERECDGSDPLDFNGPARFCAGEPARFNQALAFPYTCDGIVTDDSMDMTCTYSIDALPGCTAIYDYTVSAVRVGDVMTGTEDFLLTFVGDCDGYVIYCSVTDFTGARIAMDPQCATSPITSASWSEIKSIYR